MIRFKDSIINYFTLFGSMSTLICCALPALLVSLGLGATLAGLASNFPALIWISQYKIEVFIFSGFMLSLNGFLIWKNRNAPCPLDPRLRDACIKGRKYSLNLFIFSVSIYLIGFLFAYVLPFFQRS